MLLWAVVVVGALAALAAWTQARRLKRRLDVLNHAYWELRYEHSKLRAAVSRIDPAATPDQPAPEPPAAPGISFVPLKSLRK